MKKTLTAFTSLAALLVAIPVYAQDAELPDAGADGVATETMAPAAESSDDDERPRGHRMRMMGRFDVDQDGSISAEEFAAMGIEDVIAADDDGDGEISFEEMKAAMEARRDERMRAMFERRFDVDGDGTITVSELQDRQDKRFALLDANNDGSLSPEEFRKAHRLLGGHHGMHGRRGGHGPSRDGGWHGGWDRDWDD